MQPPVEKADSDDIEVIGTVRQILESFARFWKQSELTDHHLRISNDGVSIETVGSWRYNLSSAIGEES